MSDFEVYSGPGLVYTSVCTSLTDEQATDRINSVHPTGISSSWRIADEAFRDGSSNGRPCEDKPETHRHLLFAC